uniref:Bm6037, isoform a n=1 Tax=Brugia malayi TaxID=6279 RepID=A0A1I9G0U7_BRUMA|nr:Bm6037, isoform a [Brugia malayi]
MIVKPAALFSAFVSTVYTLQNPLISAPFDNFRIECAKSSGAVGISVRMVGSQGFIRQDTVFAIICERVDELYPWHGIPISIAELEREDCYYSHLFDPVVDTESLYTCRPREYISGITRLSDTRVQVLCCRLRTRDEANCQEKEFTKPIGFDPRTDIYHRKQLINSIAVEGHNYRVRFCDLAPRAIGLFVVYLLKSFFSFFNLGRIYVNLKVTNFCTFQSSSPANLKNTAEDVYDPAKFYRTVPPKRPTQTEKVLTFCTKEIAIRDRHNLVIACGSETEIWQPFRCPAGSECFSSTDSSYRICCAVAEIYLC